MRPGSRRPAAAPARSSFPPSRSPSFNDEQLHFAEPDPQATITRYQALGLDRIIVKNGGKGIVMSDYCAIRRIETVPVAAVVDSTSAGDSRNGAFLARFTALGNSV
ncbi:PfkB family carbohydrate kinase [Sinorhizobium meliloti]|uniref:PfkB family carbohydrate kinase n=1 Tax=Rhizobium meliloti TaxID=382 RepID=UPI00299D45D4